jgi:hypothetical protein
VEEAERLDALKIEAVNQLDVYRVEAKPGQR